MHKLRITNIPRWITEIHLKQFFNNCGKIVQASVAVDQNTLRPMGYGFLTFEDDQATEKALSKHGAFLDGSQIEVQIDADIDVTAPVE